MDKKYEPLFTPWKIGNVEIKNRIVMTSMGGTSIFGWMEPNHFDKEAANFLLEKAKNNVGLILPGIAPVRNPIRGEWLYQNKRMYRKLAKFMDEIHSYGAKMFIQITAGFGRSMAVNESLEKLYENKFLKILAKPLCDVDAICASCSELPNRWSDKLPSRAMSVEEIEKMIEAFAKTAELCKEAGVDGVEIHAVHEGYLLDQFTLKYCNKRTDQYGGNFENRYRFATEIVKAIKERCGSDYPVSLRYSVVSYVKDFRKGALPGEDYIEVGRDMRESEQAIKLLEKAGYDMFNCDNGTYDSWYWAHPPIYMPESCNLTDVAHIKKFTTKPVVCAGRMDPTTAAEAIKNGEIDGMGVARQFLADTEWVTKLMEGREEEIKPCICCHNGCFTMCHYKGVSNTQPMEDVIHMARCAITAETMQTTKYYIKEAKNQKDVAIIGGGIGGMEAARVLKLRGHNPVIYEKTDHLGGTFVYACKADFKGKCRDLLEWYKSEMDRMNIEVHLNTEVKDLNELNADEYIVATGSKPRSLAKFVKGFDKSVEACEFLGGKPVGERVIVLGGGLTGCEIAYELHLMGKTPVIVEMKNDLVAMDGVCLANSSFLREYFELHDIEVHLETAMKEIRDGEAICKDKDGNEVVIPCDNVIASCGYIPTPLCEESRHVHLVGDCNKIGNLRTVIWKAYKVAMDI